MSSLPPPRSKPANWFEHKQSLGSHWTFPFHGLEWTFQWCAYYLGKWAFLEVLQYLGTLSILFAAISYFWEAGDRKKQKHYQAWQVINTAQGKGGSGGRIEALRELNADHVPLVGVDASDAFLHGIQLRHGNLLRASFASADARDSDWQGSNFDYANMRFTNLRNSNLRDTRFVHTEMEGCDLAEADLSGADFSGAILKNADLRNANLAGVNWKQIESIEQANIYGVRNAPPGFIDWALAHGAVATSSQ